MLDVTLTELKGVVAPTAPLNVVVPVPPAIDNAFAPLTVVAKVMFALLDVTVLFAFNFTAEAKLRGLIPLTVILPPT